MLGVAQHLVGDGAVVDPFQGGAQPQAFSGVGQIAVIERDCLQLTLGCPESGCTADLNELHRTTHSITNRVVVGIPVMRFRHTV